MDIFAILLIIATIWNIKTKKSAEAISSDYFSLDTCNMLKGFFAVAVIFDHLAQRTSGGLIFPRFYFMGSLSVSVFLFISGYGLIKKLLSDESYLDTFIPKRVRTIVIPYLIVSVIYWGGSYVTGECFTVKEVLQSFVNGNPVATNSWYMIVCILLYTIFYLTAKLLKSKDINNPIYIVIPELVFCFVWVRICKTAGYKGHWYNANLAFSVGVVWCIYEERILLFLNKSKNYYLTLSACTVAFFLTFAIGVLRNIQPLSIISIALFAVLVAMACMKVKLNSPALRFLGKISMEIYLIHGLYTGVFRSNILTLDRSILYSGAVLALTIPSAMALHWLFSKISKSRTTRATINA